jgi:hypothetical protein
VKTAELGDARQQQYNDDNGKPIPTSSENVSKPVA